MALSYKNKGFAALIEAGFTEKVGYQSKGRTKKMPRLELMVLQKILGAAQGDPAAIRFLIKHIKKPEKKVVENDISTIYWHSTSRQEVKYRDGRVEHIHIGRSRQTDYPDGHSEIQHSDGRFEYVHADGCRQTNYPDDRIEVIDEKGEAIWTSEQEIEALGDPTTVEELRLRRGS